MSPLSSRSTIGTAASAAAATTTRAQPDGDPMVGQPVVTVTPLLIRYPFRTKHPDHVQVITPPHPSPPILAAVATTATASTSTTTTNGSHSSHADGNNVVGASTAAQFPADALGLRVSPPGTSEELRRRRLGPGAARDNQSHPDGHQDEDSKPSAIPTTTTTAVTTTTTATTIIPQSFSTRETRRNTYHDGTNNNNNNNSRSTKKQKTSHSATAIAATTVTVAPAVATTIGTTVPAETTTTTTMEYSARNRRSKCRKRSISRRNNRRKRKRGPIVVDDNGEDGPFYEIGKILAKRQRQDSDGLVNDSNDDDNDDDDEQEEEQLEYLIRWKGCDSNEDCWVPAGDLCDTAWDDVQGEKLDIPWYHDYYDHHANDQHANDEQQQQGGGGGAVVMAAAAAAAVYREHEKRWDGNFQKLQQYKNVHGHCNVPSNYALDKSLARWVQKQRHLGMLKRRRGRLTPLTNRREEKLNSIGFAWSVVQAVRPNEHENDDDDTLPDEAEAASEQQQQHPWEYHFEKLEQYKAVHGHCRVPSKYALDKSLGRWVKEQRHQGALRRKHLTSTVSKWRLEKLNSIGFVWEIENQDDDDEEQQQQGQTAARQGRRKNAALPQQESRIRPPPPPPQEQEQQRRVGHYLEAQWEAQFEKLQQYKNEHGHCRVPVGYPRDRTLGNWVHKQRSQGALKRKGLHSTLTDPREQKLNGIGFSWDWSSTPRHISTTSANESGGDDDDDDDNDEPPRRQHKPEQRVLANANKNSKFSDERWESHFAKLERYKELHGDCMVPTEYELDLPLGHWVRKQRYQRARKHQGLESMLTDQREERLDAIGFVWKASRGQIKDRVNEIDDTPEQEEDEQEEDDDDEQDEEDEPEAVANNSVREERWETLFQKVKRYKEVHGDCMIPTNYSADKKLGQWVRTQRSQRVLKYHGRKSGLSDLREQKLDAIGFVWDATRPRVQQQEQEQHEAEVVGNSLEEQWEAQFQKLQRYKKVHGDCRVPTKNPHLKKLGIWVRTQRYQRKLKYQGRKSALTDRREQKLNGIGFVWGVAGLLQQKNKSATIEKRSTLHRRRK